MRGIHLDDSVSACCCSIRHDGAVVDYRTLCEQAHAAGALVTVAPTARALPARAAGELGRMRSQYQRFGVPMGYGARTPRSSRRATIQGLLRGHHRRVARRDGKPALRMALRPREHIRREKPQQRVHGQVLLAVLAGCTPCITAPRVAQIASRTHALAVTLASGSSGSASTSCTRTSSTPCGRGRRRRPGGHLSLADARGINLRVLEQGTLTSRSTRRRRGRRGGAVAVFTGTHRTSRRRARADAEVR